MFNHTQRRLWYITAAMIGNIVLCTCLAIILTNTFGRAVTEEENIYYSETVMNPSHRARLISTQQQQKENLRNSTSLSMYIAGGMVLFLGTLGGYGYLHHNRKTTTD